MSAIFTSKLPYCDLAHNRRINSPNNNCSVCHLLAQLVIWDDLMVYELFTKVFYICQVFNKCMKKN